MGKTKAKADAGLKVKVEFGSSKDSSGFGGDDDVKTAPRPKLSQIPSYPPPEPTPMTNRIVTRAYAQKMVDSMCAPIGTASSSE
ncbi:UNVERIFIED_CONTAM: hypothetical protein ITH36_25240, partial [Salmonella enterica subsp. enterica serovar Weltevreden]